MASGWTAFSLRTPSPVMESASEHPEFRSGTMTVASGESIFAVSAMNTTPANMMIFARESLAIRLR